MLLCHKLMNFRSKVMKKTFVLILQKKVTRKRSFDFTIQEMGVKNQNISEADWQPMKCGFSSFFWVNSLCNWMTTPFLLPLLTFVVSATVNFKLFYQLYSSITVVILLTTVSDFPFSRSNVSNSISLLFFETST